MDTPEEHQQGLQKIHYSGDDLEDDFLEESILGNKDGVSSTNLKSPSGMDKIAKNTHEKPKQGPKIVNFLEWQWSSSVADGWSKDLLHMWKIQYLLKNFLLFQLSRENYRPQWLVTHVENNKLIP